VEIGGVPIPADANLLLLLGSANRDPAVFDDPEHFDIHRQNAKEHLSFGFGAHYCLGAPLVRLEVRIVLEELSARLPGLRLFADRLLRDERGTRDVATGPGEASDHAHPDRVAHAGKDDWDCARCRLGGQRGGGAPRRDDYVHPEAHQVGGEAGKAIVPSISPAILESDVASLDVVQLTERLAERFEGRTRDK
jgi:hypothetical protein